MKCSNCKAALSCSCKKRAAKDGTACCANCVAAYNSSITVKK